MNEIRCGHCGGAHASVAEIRQCSSTSSAVSDARADHDEPPHDTDADAAVAGRVSARGGAERSAQRAVPTGRPAGAVSGRSGSQPSTSGVFDMRPTSVAVIATSSEDPWRWAGPDELGRGVILRSDQDVPEPWVDAPVVELPAAFDKGLARAVADLQVAWSTRQRIVVRLAEDSVIDGQLASGGEVMTVEPWTMAPTFTFARDQLAFLLSANLVDGRDGRFTWRWAALAIDLGATLDGTEPGRREPSTHRPGTASGAADQSEGGDVTVAGVGRVWCDGGPFHPTPVEDIPVLGWQNIERSALKPWGSNASPGDGAGRSGSAQAPEPGAMLAPDQLAAVTHSGGATRIVAPAGSGKTRVLTERLRQLADVWGYPSASLTVVAFNRRARDELVERTTGLAAMHIRTLNSLGLAIVAGDRPFTVGERGPRPRMLSERDQRALLDELVGFKRSLSQDPAAPWLEALRAVRLGLINPEQVEEEFGGDVDGLTDVFPRYRDRLKAMNALDFDEQIYGAVEILMTDPDRRRRAQQAMRMVLVDEFQDLTPAHVLLIRLCAAPGFDVFGVGDDDQTIYGYNGADPKWLIHFDQVAPGAASRALTVNYRCPPGVVDAARSLLSYNEHRVDKEIFATPGRTGNELDVAVLAVDDETAATVDAVVEQLTERDPGDVAVLTRVNVTLAAVQVALSVAGVPVVNTVDSAVLNRTGLRAALAWLRLGLYPDQLDARLIADAARRPSRALSPKVVEWMGEQRSVSGLARLAGRLDDKSADKVKGFCSDLEGLVAVCRAGSASAAIGHIREDIGLGSALTSLDLSRRAVERASHADDLDALLALARLHEDPDDFATWLRQSLDAPGVPIGSGVVLSTIHKVKGQQWPHVIVHGVDIGRFPHALAEDIEEERRVFHVAMTRASERLTVVADRDLASPFIAEMRGERPRRKLGSSRPTQPPSASGGRSRGTTGTGVRVSPAGTSKRRRSQSKGTSQPVWYPILGAEVHHGGHRGTVERITDDGVAMRVGEALLRIQWTAEITVDGTTMCLAQPSRDPQWSERALDELKRWRTKTAQADSVPAYVVFNDATLGQISHELPTTLDELALCRGVGPAKLDRYGDEVLGIISDSE